MNNLVIVAIPDKEDIVWKISSEQVPHMTILNLGEQDPNPQTAKIMSYLEHAVDTMLRRFRMAVDHRGVLGPNEADVLFFDKSFCEKQVKDFREALLKNPDVLEFYNGSDQFPEWVPHLTLGFPATPAHPDTRDYTDIYSVGFGKIALWVDNFDGPEVELKSREASDLWAEHSGTVRERALAHAGKQPYDPAARRERYLRERELKGRPSGSILNKPAPGTSGPADPDKVWADSDHLNALDRKIFLAASVALDKVVKSIVAKYNLKNINGVQKNPAALKELTANYTSTINNFADRLGKSPSGKLKMHYSYNPSTHSVKYSVVPTSVGHSIDIPGFSLDTKLNEMNDALHFGRLGQKWGVIHPRGAGGLVTIPKGRSTRAQRRAIRKGHLHSVSSEDLKTLTDRINLENNYRQAVSNSSRTAALNVKAKRALDLGKKANDAVQFGNSVVGQALLKQISPTFAARVHGLANTSDALTGGKSGKKDKKSDLNKLVSGLTPAVTGKHAETTAERRVRVANSMRGR